ncbi:myozenin-2-like isoform 2-T2 [Aulostomus maculatus]
MMQSGVDNVAKQRMLQARALAREAKGGRLNLGKKISVPKDVMMEELNLQSSNRGSRMFQERQKRVERFTLENAADGAFNTISAYADALPPPPVVPGPQRVGQHQGFTIPGKHSLVMNLQKTVAKKGSPDVLAPGYSGPLKEIPHEKFNTTVVPRSYCSPWREALGGNDDLPEGLSSKLPPREKSQQPLNYRSPMPFGGGMASKRVIPVIAFEAVEAENLPSIALDRMCRRPNFNKAPKGWGAVYSAESNEL